MVKVMAVYDEDPLYAGRLAEYVNQKETFPFSGNGIFQTWKN